MPPGYSTRATDELGHGYDVVIDCVGKPGLLDQCVAAAVTKGRVVVAGVCTEPDPYIPAMALMKELTVAFSVYYRPDEFRSVIDAFMAGQIDPSPLITRNVPLDQIDDAFGACRPDRSPTARSWSIPCGWPVRRSSRTEAIVEAEAR